MVCPECVCRVGRKGARLPECRRGPCLRERKADGQKSGGGEVRVGWSRGAPVAEAGGGSVCRGVASRHSLALFHSHTEMPLAGTPAPNKTRKRSKLILELTQEGKMYAPAGTHSAPSSPRPSVCIVCRLPCGGQSASLLQGGEGETAPLTGGQPLEPHQVGEREHPPHRGALGRSGLGWQGKILGFWQGSWGWAKGGCRIRRPHRKTLHFAHR